MVRCEANSLSSESLICRVEIGGIRIDSYLVVDGSMIQGAGI